LSDTTNERDLNQSDMMGELRKQTKGSHKV
jgi:hypothetical protein